MGKENPFGNLTEDIGKQRLLCVGIGGGMVFGALGGIGPISKSIIVIFGITLVVVRYLAQKHWPDQKAEGDPLP
jgi:hypothetical protein